MGRDEPIDLPQHQGVRRPEQLDARDPDAAAPRGGSGGTAPVGGGADGGGDEEGDIVTGVHLHDLAGADRPEQLVGLPARMLDHQRRRVYCLAMAMAIPHAQLLCLQAFFFTFPSPISLSLPFPSPPLVSSFFYSGTPSGGIDAIISSNCSDDRTGQDRTGGKLQEEGNGKRKGRRSEEHREEV